MLKKIAFWGLGLLALVVGVCWTSSQLVLADAVPAGAIQGLDKPSAIYLVTDADSSGLGQPIDTTDTQNYEYKAGQNYQLVYKWSVSPGTDISAGKTVTFIMPKNIAATPLGFNLYRGNDTKTNPIGSLYKAAGTTTATITFTDELKGDTSFANGVLIAKVAGSVSDTSSGTGGSDAVISKGGWFSSNNADWVKNEGTLYPKIAIWDAIFNPETQNMGDVTLTDDLGPYLTFEPATFSATNETTGQRVPETDYAIESSPSSSEIKFIFKHVTGKIHLSYTTSVDYQKMIAAKLVGGNLSNYIRLSAEDGESGGSGSVPGSGSSSGNPTVTGDSHKDQPWGASGSGTLDGSSFLGSVIFEKDSAREEKLGLSGAVYNLQKQNTAGEFADFQTNVSTDSLGQIRNSSLPIGVYRYQEIKAPVGYQLNLGEAAYSSVFTIAITDNTSQPHRIRQTDAPFKVTLTKTAQETNKVLSGASYRLYLGNNLKVPVNNLTYKTDANGQLTVSPIAKGSYDFIEQTPPAGYKLDQTPIPFTISDEKSASASQPTGPDVTVSQTDESSTPLPNTDSGGSSSSSSSSVSSNGSSSFSASSSNDSTSTNSDRFNASSKSKFGGSTTNSTTSSSHTTTVGSTPVLGTSATNRGGSTSTVTGHGQHTHRANTGANRFLPKTSEEKTIFAALGGLLLIGSGLSIWRFRRTQKN